MEVAKSLGKGLRSILPEAEIQMVPMADGGEGTVEALIDATGGRRLKVRVHDPLMRELESAIGITGDGETAVIEMAAASGLQQISREERNPWITTTYGTGEMIRAALDQGCGTILLGIGGSATNDCGAGMAEALGIKFLGEDGNPVSRGGGGLGYIRKIDMSGLDPRISRTRILVACDVTNPLTGPDGASHVYGPQKGADPSMVRRLDDNVAGFAGLIGEQLGKDVDRIPGAGAAGGLGAGLIAFLDARLVHGVTAISERIGLEDKIKRADLVITGEGTIDFQTQFGKTPFGVARLAKQHNKPVIAVAGTLGEGFEVLSGKGFDTILSILDAPMTLEEAIAKTPVLLEKTGKLIGSLLKIGKIL
jgi:glycerate kinase